MKKHFHKVIFIFFCGIQSYGSAQTVGTVFSDSFTGTSLQSYWRVNSPSALLTINNKLIVSGGDSSFHNFLEYNVKRLPYEKLNFSTIVVPQEKNATSYGISLYADSDSILYGTSLEVTLDLTDGNNSGRIMIGYNHQTPVSVSTALPFQPGDTIRFTINRDGWTFIATAQNYNSSEMVQTSLVNSSGRGSGGFWRLVFLGGASHITQVQMDAASKTFPRNIVIGNSITAGAGASTEAKRYVNLLFNQEALKFETIAMPSIKTADVLKYIQEAIDLKPQYALLSVGTNDRNQFTDTNIFRSNYDTLVRKLKDNNITPILLTLVASGHGFIENVSTWYNGIIQRIGNAYNAKVVDINPLLKNSSGILSNSYSMDNVHPNDSGHYIIANHIYQTAPELNGIQILPLKLLSFEAHQGNGLVHLQWVTAEEQNLLKFEVERSNDGVHFHSTASEFSKQAGGSTEIRYKITDAAPPTATHLYYRLKIINNDLSFEYSDVKKLVQSNRDQGVIQVYPNPASNYVFIRLPVLQAGNNFRIELMSSHGRIVFSSLQRSGSGFIRLSTAQFAAGIYIVRIIDEENSVTQAKLFIQ